MEIQAASESQSFATTSSHAHRRRRNPHDLCDSLERSSSADARAHVDGCALFVLSALRHITTRESSKHLLAMEVVNGTRHYRLWRLFGALVRSRHSISSDWSSDSKRISTVGQFVASVAAIPLTLLVCRLSYVNFEKPLLKAGHRLRYE